MRALLALDTSTPTSSVALYDLDGGVVLAEAAAAVTTHSETLLSMIDDVVRRGGVTPRQLAAVACGGGPGSFTGLRIGVATAKGLCYALSVPLVLVSSLAAVAEAAAQAGAVGRVAVVLDAKKGSLYAGVFQVGGGELRALGDEVLVLPAALAAAVAARAGGDVVVAGDGLGYPEAAALGVLVPGLAQARPHARDVARMASRRLARGEHDDLATAEPRYASDWKSGDPNARPKP